MTEILIDLTVEQAFELLEFLKNSLTQTNEGVDYVIELLEYQLEDIEFENDD